MCFLVSDFGTSFSKLSEPRQDKYSTSQTSTNETEKFKQQLFFSFLKMTLETGSSGIKKKKENTTLTFEKQKDNSNLA